MITLISEMSVEEFEAEYAKRSGVSVEFLHEHNQYAVPCNCEENNLPHWQMKQRYLWTAAIELFN